MLAPLFLAILCALTSATFAYLMGFSLIVVFIVYSFVGSLELLFSSLYLNMRRRK